MSYRILICYKNFSKECHISHIGLGVTAQYTAKSLAQAGYNAIALPIFGGDELFSILTESKKDSIPVTHVSISAMFIPTIWLMKLARTFPQIHFALNCHSNVGFLQAEPQAITLLREAIDLETGTSNFFAGGNNKRFCEILTDMYGRSLQYLPNLYYLNGNEQIHRSHYQNGPIKIGIFGSLRIYKNISSAVAAAIELGFQLRQPIQIWINSGRSDGAGNIVFKAAKAWTNNLSNVSLNSYSWSSWPEFKHKIGTMNILLQPSYTETFNNVTADGIVEGVPSVVTEAIEWAPESWKVCPDDTKQIAIKARHLLFDPHAAKDGYKALKEYRTLGLQYWKQFLERH